MEKLITQYSSQIAGLMALIFGTGSLKFILSLIRMNARNRANRATRERLYEVAFGLAVYHYKTLAQCAVPACEIYVKSKDDAEKLLARMPPYMDILCGNLGFRTDKGGWQPNPLPNFLQVAREEIESAQAPADDYADEKE